MTSFPRLTFPQALVALAGLSLAAVACLSPVHNDTWWHLAYGREMAAIGGFAQVDRFSHTGYGRPFPNHQWLSERIFYALHVVGGLPLLTAFCAALLTGGWVLCWRLSRGALSDRLLVMAGAVAASTMVWSIRPQAFTVALLPLTLTLLSRHSLGWVPPVILLWSNLHGGVLLGMVAIVVWTCCAFALHDSRRWVLAATLALSAGATFVTPLGVRYWPEIVASLRRSQVNRLQEWQAPAGPPEHVFFWLAAGALVALAAVRWRRLTTLSDRALAITALVLLVPASRSLRNIAPFMMAAGPALSLLLARSSQTASAATRSHPLAAGLVVAGVVGSAVLIALAWATPWRRLNWQPMTPAAAAAIRDCPEPIYNTYAGGGPIIWMVPEQRVFVDSRQDHYPAGVIALATDLENGADPGPAFRKFGVRCAALPPSSPVVGALLKSGWRVAYQDLQWAVLVHTASGD